MGVMLWNSSKRGKCLHASMASYWAADRRSWRCRRRQRPGRADPTGRAGRGDGRGDARWVAQVGVPIRATVVLDTHTVALDDVVFERAVALRTPGGAEVAPTRVEGVKGGGHHRQAVVVFPAVTEQGTVRMVVRNVGGIAERVFVWE